MSSQFEALIEQYHRLVMTLIHRYYGGRFKEDAEDLSQEIWTKLWESFKKNEHNIVNFKSYLYRTVQTTLWDALHALDKTRGHEVLEDCEHLGDVPDEDGILERMQVEHLLEQLKPEEARMVRAYLKGFTHAEIAVLMGCGEGRVRNLLTRIKKKMAE